MIIVEMEGSIGELLFQYATAKSLAIDRNSNMLIYSKGDEDIESKLEHFNFDCDRISLLEINHIENLQKVIESNSLNTFDNFIDFTKYSGNIYLKGYWQNEKYFKHNRLSICKDLTVNSLSNLKNKYLLQEINESESVCISFKQSRFFDSYFLAQFGICTREYYNNAIRFISKKIESPTFYIFTDDTDGIEDVLELNFPKTIVNVNQIDNEYEELRLMCSCKHFILDNSTFSWWGAWLSNNKKKLVFAPTPWSNSFTKQSILCPNWIQLKNDYSYLFKKSDNNLFSLVTINDLHKINFDGFEIDICKWGISLNSFGIESKFNFNFDEDFLINKMEFVIEFKLFSNKKNFIKIDHGSSRKIFLGYRKGHSIRYIHLRDVDLNSLIFEINDSTLIIEDITIKSVNSKFNL